MQPQGSRSGRTTVTPSAASTWRGRVPPSPPRPPQRGIDMAGQVAAVDHVHPWAVRPAATLPDDLRDGVDRVVLLHEPPPAGRVLRVIGRWHPGQSTIVYAPALGARSDCAPRA